MNTTTKLHASTTMTPFLLALIVVATAVHQGNAAVSSVRSGSTVTSTTTENSSLTDQHRKLNFLEDLWNDMLGNPGSGSVSGEFVPGGDVFPPSSGGDSGELWDPNNDNDNYDFDFDGGSDFNFDNGGVIDWGNDGSWDDWLTDILNDGFLEDVFNGDGFENFDLGDFDLGGLIGNLTDMDLSGLDFSGLDFGNGFNFDSIGNMITDFDVCSVVEMAIGMSPSFGTRANCRCVGDFTNGFDIDCSFEQCGGDGDIGIGDGGDVDAAVEGGECGTVNLDFSFGGPDGKINATACSDLVNDDLEETCFSYEIDMRNGEGGGIDDATKTCEATYGGNPCDCTIDNSFCLSVDCSLYLSGGKMDTCQFLSMDGADDVASWFPNFDAFLPGFEDGSLPNFDELLPDVDGDNNDLPNLGELLPDSEWEEDNNEEEQNDVDLEEEEEEEIPVDITNPPARPDTPLEGELVTLQTSELINSGGGTRSTSIFSTEIFAAGLVSVVAALLFQ